MTMREVTPAATRTGKDALEVKSPTGPTAWARRPIAEGVGRRGVRQSMGGRSSSRRKTTKQGRVEVLNEFPRVTR